MRVSWLFVLACVAVACSSAGSTTACKSPGEICSTSTECQQWECSCAALPSKGLIRLCKSGKCADEASACATLGCMGGAFTATTTNKPCTPPDASGD